MTDKVNIVIERKETGYQFSFPELENQQFQEDSLDQALAKLKEILLLQLQVEKIPPQTPGESILSAIAKFSQDMTEEEIERLPTDAAEQHDHYLYGTPKKTE